MPYSSQSFKNFGLDFIAAITALETGSVHTDSTYCLGSGVFHTHSISFSLQELHGLGSSHFAFAALQASQA